MIDIPPLIQGVGWERDLSPAVGLRVVDQALWARTATGVLRFDASVRHWVAVNDDTALLPSALQFTADGWTRRPRHGTDPWIQVAGLSSEPSLFDEHGRFLFDVVRDVAAADAVGVWLLSKAGWIQVDLDADTHDWARYTVYPAEVPAGETRLYLPSEGVLMLDLTVSSDDRRAYAWSLRLDQAPEPKGTAALPAGLVQRQLGELSVSALSGQIILQAAQRTVTVCAAAPWYWPFEVPFRFGLDNCPEADSPARWLVPQPVEFVADGAAVYVITPDGLIRIDRGQIDLR